MFHCSSKALLGCFLLILFAIAGCDDDPPPRSLPPIPPLVSHDKVEVLLNREPIQLTAGFSEEVSIEIPEGSSSLSFTLEGIPGEYYTLDHWRSPDGVDLVPLHWFEDDAFLGICTTCPNRITQAEHAFAALIPNTPEIELKSGKHTFRIVGATASRASEGVVSVSVHVKSLEKSLSSTGVLDLNFYFTGAAGLWAKGAFEDPRFLQTIGELREIYAQVGVEIGQLTYQDIGRRFLVIESIQGMNSDLRALFEESTEQTHNAINVFFVEEIHASVMIEGSDAIVLGIAGGVVGPVLVQGSAQGGVAVSTITLGHPSAEQNLIPSMAEVIAHEVGHYLGLFHTSEQPVEDYLNPGVLRTLHDPLSDTAENDEGLLMHWSGNEHRISPSQGAVMIASPWVRHPGVGDKARGE